MNHCLTNGLGSAFRNGLIGVIWLRIDGRQELHLDFLPIARPCLATWKHFVGTLEGDWNDGHAHFLGENGEGSFEGTESAIHTTCSFREDGDNLALPQDGCKCLQGMPDVPVKIHYNHIVRACEMACEGTIDVLGSRIAVGVLDGFAVEESGEDEGVQVALVVRRENKRAFREVFQSSSFQLTEEGAQEHPSDAVQMPMRPAGAWERDINRFMDDVVPIKCLILQFGTWNGEFCEVRGQCTRGGKVHQRIFGESGAEGPVEIGHESDFSKGVHAKVQFEMIVWLDFLSGGVFQILVDERILVGLDLGMRP